MPIQRKPKSRTFVPDARVTLGVVVESVRDDNRPFAFPVRPHEVSIFRNGYNEADTFSLTFNASHLPLTPELIRASSAEIYLFNKRNIQEQPDSITKGDDTLLALDGIEVKPSIVGLVDEATMDYDESGRYVSMQGRDYTALYLDTDWDNRTRIPYKGRLDTVIQRLADDVPASNGVMTVKVDLGLDPTTFQSLTTFRSVFDFARRETPEAILDRKLPIVGRHETRANKKGLVFPNKANFWEVMSAIAIRYGFIVFVKGTDIILTTPKAYIAGRTGSLSMAWGENLHDIHLSRKLGRERVPVIECASWDPKRQITVVGQYPSAADSRKQLKADKAVEKSQRRNKSARPKKATGKRKPGKNATGLGTVKEEIQQYVIPGITSKDQLTAIAEQVYQQRGRSEMTLQLSTSDLEDSEGTPILDISSGDAMQVKFTPFNAEIKTERLMEDMVKRGYHPMVASKISVAIEEMNNLRSPMRVDSATLDFDLDNGITITATLRQFVNIYVQEENA